MFIADADGNNAKPLLPHAGFDGNGSFWGDVPGDDLARLVVSARFTALTSAGIVRLVVGLPLDGDSGGRCIRIIDVASHSVPTQIGWHFAKRDRVLCQNCVTSPLKP